MLFQGVKQQTQFLWTPPEEGIIHQNTQGAIIDVSVEHIQTAKVVSAAWNIFIRVCKGLIKGHVDGNQFQNILQTLYTNSFILHQH